MTDEDRTAFKGGQRERTHLDDTIDVLVQRRHDRGMTPDDIAKAMGAQDWTITRIENRIAPVSWPMAVRYAAAMGIRLTVLIDEPEDPDEPLVCGHCNEPITQT